MELLAPMAVAVAVAVAVLGVSVMVQMILVAPEGAVVVAEPVALEEPEAPVAVVHLPCLLGAMEQMEM